ncbi:MAG: hypothetical protein WC617_10480 [Rhodanobacter sp.]|jgi:hypothetical protein
MESQPKIRRHPSWAIDPDQVLITGTICSASLETRSAKFNAISFDNSPTNLPKLQTCDLHWLSWFDARYMALHIALVHVRRPLQSGRSAVTDTVRQ